MTLGHAQIDYELRLMALVDRLRDEVVALTLLGSSVADPPSRNAYTHAAELITAALTEMS